MANSADPDQLASSGKFSTLYFQFYTVCKGRVYLGSAGQGLSFLQQALKCYTCTIKPVTTAADAILNLFFL